jgi:hypothetical protein
VAVEAPLMDGNAAAEVDDEDELAEDGDGVCVTPGGGCLRPTRGLRPLAVVGPRALSLDRDRCCWSSCNSLLSSSPKLDVGGGGDDTRAGPRTGARKLPPPLPLPPPPPMPTMGEASGLVGAPPPPPTPDIGEPIGLVGAPPVELIGEASGLGERIGGPSNPSSTLNVFGRGTRLLEGPPLDRGRERMEAAAGAQTT